MMGRPDRGPERLCELTCPQCRRVSWIIDCVLPAEDSPDTYAAREYACTGCGATRTGWVLGERSPIGFLDPSCDHPMTIEEFNRWLEILKAHQPGYWRLDLPPEKFQPVTPEEARETLDWFDHEFPVEYMVDQDGARRAGTMGVTYDEAIDWADMMNAGDSLRIVLKNGCEITVQARVKDDYSFRCVDNHGHTVATHPTLDFEKLRAMIWYQLLGQPRTADNQHPPADDGPHGRVLQFADWRKTATTR